MHPMHPESDHTPGAKLTRERCQSITEIEPGQTFGKAQSIEKHGNLAHLKKYIYTDSICKYTECTVHFSTPSHLDFRSVGQADGNVIDHELQKLKSGQTFSKAHSFEKTMMTRVLNTS